MDTLNRLPKVDNNIEETARTLIESVKVTLDSCSTYHQRCQAFEFIEKIKDDYEYALSCGFFLSSLDDPIVKHLGLELLENTIRYHWNDVSIENKLQIKDCSMELLTKGTNNISAEHNYIKDKISRLVVEMIKREWPQQWPNLLEELSLVAETGPNQAEIVLLILLRLAEDVEVLENSYSRRRDLYLSLSSNMDFLFNLFMNLLEVHYKRYKELELLRDSAASSHCRVTQVIYMTLSGFLEWIPMLHIMAHQKRLITSLCLLIQDKNIRQSAAECLLRLVSRKSDGKQLLILFDKEVMEAIFSAAGMSVTDDLSEPNYTFLKTLFQFLTSLGMQLCTLWSKEPDVPEPLTFGIFLHSILEFMRHPSLTIYSYGNPLMIQLFKNHQALKTKAFNEMIPHWIPVAFKKLKKIGFPSRNGDEECKYSALDFDDDADYTSFFINVRNSIVLTLKDATLYYPEICLSHAEEYLNSCLLMPLSNENEQTDGLYPSPLQTEWDFVAVAIDAVIPRLSKCRSYKPPINRIKVLLEKCLQYEIHVPRIETQLLSCISTLCAFLPDIPEYKDDVVCKLFKSFRYKYECDITANKNKKSDKRYVFFLRNHSCAILVKLCKLFPNHLLSSFSFIAEQISLIQDLISSEVGIFLQAQILLLNELNQFETQNTYLGQLIQPYSEKWVTLSTEFSDYSTLIKFLGLDNIPSSENINVKLPSQENRSALWKCLIIFFYVVKNVKTPQPNNVAVGAASKTDSISHNPATQYLFPLLESLFCLCKSLNNLLLPEALALHSSEFAKAHEIPLMEVKNILNLNSQQNSNSEEMENLEETSLEKMKLYMKNVFEQSCRILGNIGLMISLEFYKIPHLSDIVIQSMFSNWDNLPDFKIRYILKGFYRPFIFSCPKELYESVCLPVINYVTIAMLTRLNLRWEYVHKVMQSSDYDEDATDTKEMTDLIVIQVLTRDYIDTIKDMLLYAPKALKNGVPEVKQDFCETEMETTDDVEMSNVDKKSSSAQLTFDGIGPLGKMIMRCDPICQAQVLTLCSALSWKDSMSNLKGNACLRMYLSVMLEDHQDLSSDAVKHIFMSLLSGIHMHGNDHLNLIPLMDTSIMLYEKLAHQFPVIKEISLSLPLVSPQDYEQFESTMAKVNLKKNSKSEKFKRESFKNIVKGVISKNLSEAFQKEVCIKELTPMFKKPRNKQPRLDEGSSNLDLCKLFNPTADI